MVVHVGQGKPALWNLCQDLCFIIWCWEVWKLICILERQSDRVQRTDWIEAMRRCLETTGAVLGSCMWNKLSPYYSRSQSQLDWDPETVRTNSQLETIYNHLGNGPLGHPWKTIKPAACLWGIVLIRPIYLGKPVVSVGVTIPWADRMQEERWVLFTFCFLISNAMWPAASNFCYSDFLIMRDYILKSKNQSQPFLP